MFKRKAKEPGIFDDLPVFDGDAEPKEGIPKKSGRRAMLIPAQPANSDVSSDQLSTNTGKQKEQWLEIIFDSDQRESKQKVIASWLQENYGVQKWWSQSISLMYAQWRDAPKNNSNSNTVLRISRSIEAPNFRVYSILNSENLYGPEFNRFLKLVDSERIVMSFSDSTRATVHVKKTISGSEVLIEHEFLSSKDSVQSKAGFWKTLLDQVESQISR
jgi:hypothetical protein